MQDDRSDENQTKILSVKDHLSNPETLDFWYRYFLDFKDSPVFSDNFCDAI